MTSELFAFLTLDFIPLAAVSESNLVQTVFGGLMLGVRVALGIGLVIFVHELGHFLAAKLFGVKVEKFYVGFDVPIKIGPVKFPRTLGRFTYGETEYGIGVVPLGGYVKMLGQDDDPRKLEEEAERIKLSDGDEDTEAKLDPRSYPAKPVWQRMIIISSGVVMNLITGVLFAAIAFGYGVSYLPAVVGGVLGGGPAWEAGIQPGGQVVSVASAERNEKMHFTDMQFEIITRGLDAPENPIDVAIRYDSETRQYNLKTAPRGGGRLIGISSPNAAKINKSYYATPYSIASTVLTEADAGASLVSFDGTAIKSDSIVPSSPFLDYLYKNPSKPIELSLRLNDDAGSVRSVTLPPQTAKWIGLRFAVGPIIALVNNGPAMAAGLEVGDVIEAIEGDKDLDAYGLALKMIESHSSVSLTVRRGKGDDAKSIDVTLKPSDMLQTMSPTEGTSACLAINSYGLAYGVETMLTRDPVLTSLGNSETTDAKENASLIAGDKIQSVTAIWPGGVVPEELQKEDFQILVQTLSKGWEFSESTPVTELVGVLQYLPIGTKLKVLATRAPTGLVIEAETTVREDDRVWFQRGLVLAQSESIQTAESWSEALALGWRRGWLEFSRVGRTLGMLSRGSVEAKHIGGPIRIVKMAWSEAERGVSAQLLFLTMLSMNLAILNFLPIPALDGGHMVFLLYEGIRGRRVNEEIEMRLTLAGVFALLALMVFVLFNDVVHF